MYLGEEGARAQEEARTRDARQGGRRREGGGAGACSDVLLRLSCGIDAIVWFPTSFATGQADHGARVMLARLDSEVTHRLLFAEDRTAVHEVGGSHCSAP